MASPRKILIVGCGYVGRALAARLLKQGDRPVGWVRSAESARELEAERIEAVTGDSADPAAWAKIGGDYAAAVLCASSGRGGADVYRSVYLEGARQAVSHLPGIPLWFVSSTSAYGQTDGGWVTEESPAAPATETGKVLLEAERVVLGAGGGVLRVAGIYGPERGVLLRKFLSGEAVIEGDGLRPINQIHRDDVAGALLRALDPTAPLPVGIYNTADDGPATYLDYYGWLAERLGKPMPPFGPVNAERKRGVTAKRVSNARLRAAGWQPFYPTFREGLDAALIGL